MNQKKMVACAKAMKKLIAAKDEQIKHVQNDLNKCKTPDQAQAVMRIYKPATKAIVENAWKQMELMVQALDEKPSFIVIPKRGA